MMFLFEVKNGIEKIAPQLIKVCPYVSAQIKTLKLLWLLNIFCGRRNDDGQLSFGSMGKMLI